LTSLHFEEEINTFTSKHFSRSFHYICAEGEQLHQEVLALCQQCNKRIVILISSEIFLLQDIMKILTPSD